MQQQTYSYYVVDASVMINLKRSFPTDLFQSVWDEIKRLVDSGRWKIFETVADELQDTQLIDWLDANSPALVKFDPNFNAYLSKFMAECQRNNMMLVNPLNTRNNGDPFVITLALYLESRDLGDLKRTTSAIKCCVLTDELPREHKINIPSVCDYFNLKYMHLFDLMRYHQWHVSINVKNP